MSLNKYTCAAACTQAAYIYRSSVTSRFMEAMHVLCQLYQLYTAHLLFMNELRAGRGLMVCLNNKRYLYKYPYIYIYIFGYSERSTSSQIKCEYNLSVSIFISFYLFFFYAGAAASDVLVFLANGFWCRQCGVFWRAAMGNNFKRSIV